MTGHAEQSPDCRSPSEHVVELVSMYAETDPLELPPLYHTVDPDILDAVVHELDSGTIEFRYAGYSVTLDSSGTVSVTGEPRREPRRDETAAGDERRTVNG